MKRIPTFIDGNFRGFEDMKTINKLRMEACTVARDVHRQKNADHTIYGHYDLDDDGNIETVWLYSGITKTEEEFEKIATLPKVHIYAFHRI